MTLKEIDSLIELVGSIKKIERKDGIWPIYPEGLYESLYELGGDINYMDNYKLSKDIPFEDKTIAELNTYFMWLVRGERFCDGLIACEIENKNVLKALKRFRELFVEEIERDLTKWHDKIRGGEKYENL